MLEGWRGQILRLFTLLGSSRCSGTGGSAKSLNKTLALARSCVRFVLVCGTGCHGEQDKTWHQHHWGDHGVMAARPTRYCWMRLYQQKRLWLCYSVSKWRRNCHQGDHTAIQRALQSITSGICVFFKECSCLLLLPATKCLRSREIPDGWEKVTSSANVQIRQVEELPWSLDD